MMLTNKSTSTVLVNNDNGHCSLNNNFGITVQAILAFTAFAILILKRCHEPKEERRSVAIWFCDTSKQAIGAMLIHFANVFLAELSHEKDPCTWYFINYLLDTTIGLLVIWLALRLLHVIASKKGWIRLRMGEYGSPPSFKTWLYQCGVYICVMLVEKCVILAFFQLKFWVKVKEIILLPFHGHPKIEVVIVVLIVPFIMNALMFWAVDNFLMRKSRKLLSMSHDGSSKQVQYVNHKNNYMSDDEVHMHLMASEAQDSTVIDERLGSGSESELLFRRTGSESSYK
ncbi:store-operated calcium entry regulator STIMATE-like [Clytia hemisphaerica]|uniref:Uncharacterized protein n=1 Tax=Clytia hemisphaerica TaxID=252671 RepID=A0A7M5UWL0_9CNID